MVEIRPATRTDAADLVCLVDMASAGKVLGLWESLRQPGQSLLEVGRARAKRDEGAFCWRHAWLALIDGEVAGGLVGYRLVPEDRPAGSLPAWLAALAELEALVPGAWYVNILATYPEFRGRGVAGALLREAGRVAMLAGCDRLAIIVAGDNLPARRLYERAGFREMARRPRTTGGALAAASAASPARAPASPAEATAAHPGSNSAADWLLLTARPGGE